MAGTITHSWNGTILTITSDSGTSSMDLKGAVGDIGPRGPQGAAGAIVPATPPVKGVDYWTEEDKQEIIDELGSTGGGGTGDADAVAAELEEYKTATDARLAAIEESLANGGGGSAAPAYTGEYEVL